MSSDGVVFPFLLQGVKRPIVWVSLENAHGPRGRGLISPALVDTGAASSMAPRAICEMLGHVFASGTDPSTSGGIGVGRVETFKHASRMTVLETPSGDAPPNPDSIIFGPIEIPLRCVDQRLPFLLLGQSDFLSLFRYAQNQSEGWFSLRRLRAGTGDI